MFKSASRIGRAFRKTCGRSLRKRDERGLTTLEWLLIVAAVAGLAALAIVLVQGVVDDTAEDIRGSSARGQAALVAGQSILDEGAAAVTSVSATGKFNTVAEYNLYYNGKCRRLGITYSDSGITVTAAFAMAAAAASGIPNGTEQGAAATAINATATNLTGSWCEVELPG